MFKKFGYYFNDFNSCLNFMNSKKFNLKKTQKPKHIIANSDTKFLFYKRIYKLFEK